MWAVIILEFYSDTPGIESGIGPFESYAEADAAANKFAGENGFTRGVEVQVAPLTKVA